MHRSSALKTVLAALVVSCAHGVGASSSTAASPLATATYGQAEVVVVKDPARQGHHQLKYTAGPNDGAAVVDVKLPARPERIGLGLDATGLLTVVVQTPTGLSWAHVTRPTGFRKLPNTAGAASAALYRGRVAYVCQDARAVCRASLRTKARRVLHREPKNSPWILDDARIGSDDALAIAAERDGALGASRIQVNRVGGKPKVIADANLDGGQAVLLRDISADGKHLSILRRSFVENGEPLVDPVDSLAFFRFPSGKPSSEVG